LAAKALILSSGNPRKKILAKKAGLEFLDKLRQIIKE